jgi:hypothetical protein
MIRLHSRNCLVTAVDGTVRSLDGDALRHDLRRAFRACGVAEEWTADHVALIIEEHVLSRPGTELPPIAERDLHAMVLALLPAAGFADVGQAYEALIPSAARPAEPDPFRPWDRARIEAELARLLPLGPQERAAIAARTRDALAALGLAQVRSELVRSLARHFLQQGAAGCAARPGQDTQGPPADRSWPTASPLAHPPSPSPEAGAQRRENSLGGTAPEGPWYLTPDGWPVAAVPGAGRLVEAGVLRVLPVARFLPRLRLEFDLERLAAASGTPPLPEIVFLPALARALDCVVELLARAEAAVRAAVTLPAPTLTAHLLASGLDTAVRTAILPQSARASKALCHEIRATVRAKLAKARASTVLLTFR